MEKFKTALEDNLNTPLAIALVWEIIKDKKARNIDKKATLLEMDKVLGFRLDKVSIKKEEVMELEIDAASGQTAAIRNLTGGKLPEEIIKLIKDRETARLNKDFSASDHIRDILKEKGFGIGDTPKALEITKIK